MSARERNRAAEPQDVHVAVSRGQPRVSATPSDPQMLHVKRCMRGYGPARRRS